MNICHIRSTAGYFGAEKVLATLLPELACRGIPQTLLLIHAPTSPTSILKNQLIEAGVAVFGFSSKAMFDIETLRKIIETCRRTGATAIHTHDYKSALYGWLASILLRLPLIGTVHGWTAATWRLRLYETLERWLLRRCSTVVTVSKLQRDQLLRRGMNPEAVRYIPNGVRIGRLEDRIGRNATVDVFRWVTVGRLSTEKDHQGLLMAFSMLEDFRGTRLAVVGSGPLESSLKALSERLGIASSIEWRGFTTDVESELARCHAYVSSSLTEGMPMSVLEAMAAGLPVVATAVGALPEILSGGAGLLCPPADPRALAALMSRVMKDAELREQLIGPAQKAAIARYSLAEQARAHVCLYEDLKSTQRVQTS